MGSSFDRERLFSNISYLLKQSGMKVGELEKAAGVSTGYISRASKDGNAKPGIDFIMSAADALGVGIDNLLNVELSEPTPTEQYLIRFVEKMIQDTQAGNIWWEQETAQYLNFQLEIDGHGYVQHPLFDDVVSYEGIDPMTGRSEPEARFLFKSHNFGESTFIEGSCFNFNLTDQTTLYLMNVGGTAPDTGDPDCYAKEIWVVPRHGGAQYLCDNRGIDALSNVLETLYASISESLRHPRIRSDILEVINDFMNDEDNELPF